MEFWLAAMVSAAELLVRRFPLARGVVVVGLYAQSVVQLDSMRAFNARFFWRHVVSAAAAASALTVAAAPKTREVLAALWTSARAWEKSADTYLARWIQQVGQGHVFRACYGLALALTVNYWLNEYFNRNPPPSETGEPAPET